MTVAPFWEEFLLRKTLSRFDWQTFQLLHGIVRWKEVWECSLDSGIVAHLAQILRETVAVLTLRLMPYHSF